MPASTFWMQLATGNSACGTGKSWHSSNNHERPLWVAVINPKLDSESIMDWTEKSEFRGIDLHDSFVLSWITGEGQLTFEIEASVWPESQHYEPPKPNEYTCYKRARLVFDGFNKIDGLKSMDQARWSVDADGVRDFGNIDELEDTNSGYRIIGDFGSVNLVGGSMRLEFQ